MLTDSFPSHFLHDQRVLDDDLGETREQFEFYNSNSLAHFWISEVTKEKK